MNTHDITLPLAEAKEAFAAVLPHISADPVTPILTCAYIDENQIIGTDRYTVAKHALSTEPTGPMLLPRSLVAWIARMNLKTLLNQPGLASYKLSVQALPPDSVGTVLPPITASVHCEMYGVERSMRFLHYRGTFPHVASLFDKFEPSEEGYPVGLAPEHLDKVLRFAHQYHRAQAVKFELGTKKGPGLTHPPVRAQIGALVALIQPNLLVR